MMPSKNNNNFLAQFLSSASSGSSTAANNDGNSDTSNSSNNYTLIIQMSFLLYLGEYIHARHLWRRHRSNSNSSQEEQTQLSMLWNAAKYCYLWDTGGISSLLNDGMEDDESSNLPYSTLLLRALQLNVESSLEPLGRYSKELVTVFRYRVNERLRSSYGDIREDEFMLRMNLSGDNSVEEILFRFGWQRSEVDASYLVPNQAWESPVDVQGVEDSAILSDNARIRQLSEVVMFLEQTKMNA